MENPVDPTGTPDLSINVMVFDIVDVIVNQPAHLAFTTMFLLFFMLLFYVIFDLIVNIQVWNCESSWRITHAPLQLCMLRDRTRWKSPVNKGTHTQFNKYRGTYTNKTIQTKRETKAKTHTQRHLQLCMLHDSGRWKSPVNKGTNTQTWYKIENQELSRVCNSWPEWLWKER